MGYLMSRQVTRVCECLFTLVTLKGFSHELVILCLVRWPESVNAFLHFSHLKGFSILIVRLFSFRHLEKSGYQILWDSLYIFFYLRLGVRYTDVLSLKKIWLRSCVLNSVYNLSSSPHPSERVRWKVTTSQFSLLCGGWPEPSWLILGGGGQALDACHSSLTFRSDNMVCDFSNQTNLRVVSDKFD